MDVIIEHPSAVIRVYSHLNRHNSLPPLVIDNVGNTSTQTQKKSYSTLWLNMSLKDYIIECNPMFHKIEIMNGKVILYRIDE